MPHFAPMNWIMALILFWLFLAIFISQLWWSSSPKFMSSHSLQSTKFSPWLWN